MAGGGGVDYKCVVLLHFGRTCRFLLLHTYYGMVPYLDKGYFGGTVSLPSFRVPWAFRGGTADKYSDLVKAITDEYDMLEAQIDNRL